MRLEQLEYVAAVTRLGSMRRASESLHVSQPALSESVRGLERELGVTLLDRERAGAKLNDVGRQLLPFITDIQAAVERLRLAADEQHRSRGMVRIGTVSAATVPLVAPAIGVFRAAHRGVQVEIVNAQQGDIHRSLLEGGLDLGLVNLMAGDDTPPELETTELLHGHAVLCCRTDDPIAALELVTAARLRDEPFIAMRAGYLMHRFMHKMFRDEIPTFSYSTDGADMGKLMVAQGLGVTVLPDYSVIGDPLEGSGIITTRPLAVEGTETTLVLQRHRTRHHSILVDQLHAAFVERAAIVDRV